MARHNSLEELAFAVIDEYFRAIEYCLRFRTTDSGCLGCPAALLLFCITDALGGWLRADEVMIDGKSQRIGNCAFRVFNHTCFGLQLTAKQISLLEQKYRNRLAHNAMIDIGASLAPSDTTPVFAFKSDTEAEINVFSFSALVIEAWKRFPREKLKAWEKEHWKRAIQSFRKRSGKSTT